jgi:fluoride exporter
MTRYVILFLAGGCGALLRIWLAGVAQRISGAELLPIGTFVVNILGCALFGFIWSLADERLIISGQTRFLILTGFVGSFTTFSTFAYETQALLRDAQWLMALGNVLGHCVLGIAAVILGMALGRLV